VPYTQAAEQELPDGVLRTENPAIKIPLLDIYNGIPRENQPAFRLFTDHGCPRPPCSSIESDSRGPCYHHEMKKQATLLAAAIFVLIAAFSAQCKLQRDWTKYPAIVQVDTSQDVYAVGDPHADYDRFTGVLTGAGIIAGKPAQPGQVQWKLGKAVMVLTGDMIDKGPEGKQQALPVIALLQALQTAAANAGGRVIVTMGNHEAEFLADPTDGKTADFQGELKGAGLNPAGVANCQDVGAFLCQLPMGARVNKWFFSHAGNTDGRDIKKIESDIQQGFAQHCFATEELIGDNSILEARLNGKGPGKLPWFYAGDPRTNPKDLLGKYASALGVDHILQGHQPGKVEFPKKPNREKYNLFQRYGLLFLNDGGMSQGVSGNRSIGGAMHISGSGKSETVTAVCATGKTQQLWDAKSDPGSATILCK
jgi:hypothetical protein